MFYSIRPFFLALALVCTSSLASACDSSAGTSEAKPNAAPEPEPEPEQAPTALSFNRDATLFETTLTELDATIASLSSVAEAQSGSWIVLEKIANLYMHRARLSGSYDDYAAAEATLDEAFARAAEGSGPLLTRAALHFTLHRLGPAEADIIAASAHPLLDKPTQAYIARVHGDLAFERGEYELAKSHYDASLALDHNYSILAKLARWSFRRGDFDAAEQGFGAALELMRDDEVEPRAWLHLQLGIIDLERGRYDEAFTDFRKGTEVLGGWWLIEEHIAEIAALEGMDDFALALYEEIIARTGKGEFLDAKAGLLLARGDEQGAAAAIAQAEAVYIAQLEQFPSAAYGHALAHYLEFGTPARALELADANFALRPGVPARISLAEARLAMEQGAGARETIDLGLDSGWVSADLYWVAAAAYAAVGEETRATELRAQAEALNPHVSTQ